MLPRPPLRVPEPSPRISKKSVPWRRGTRWCICEISFLRKYDCAVIARCFGHAARAKTMNPDASHAEEGMELAPSVWRSYVGA